MSFDQNGQSYSCIIILLGNIICVETYREGPYVEENCFRGHSTGHFHTKVVLSRIFANSIIQNMLYEKLFLFLHSITYKSRDFP